MPPSSSKLFLFLQVGTGLGVRLEALAIPYTPDEFLRQPVLLTQENGFIHGNVRVRMWNRRQSRLYAVSYAQFRRAYAEETDDGYNAAGEDDGEETVDDDDKVKEEGEEEAEETRQAANAPPPRFKRDAAKRRKTLLSGGFWELELTDDRPDEIGYVMLMPMGNPLERPPQQEEAPHPAHAFRIENACGSCILSAMLELDALRPFMVRTPANSDLFSRRYPNKTRRGGCQALAGSSSSATGDLITMLSGTFAICTNRMQVDYRGVRSVRAMVDDWTRLQQSEPPARINVYMVVLKASLGRPVVVLPSQQIPPGLTGRSLDIMRVGQSLCYLSTRMVNWITYFHYREEVCVAVQLSGILWEKLFPDRLAEALRHVKSTSVDVSRRGSVMMRLVFPNNTRWDADEEAAVLRDCNRFLKVMDDAMMGKALF
jgi:hypothetical protein